MAMRAHPVEAWSATRMQALVEAFEQIRKVEKRLGQAATGPTRQAAAIRR